MGILGQGWDDPQSAAIMALSGGLLQRNLAGGLLGANQAFAQHKADALKAKMAEMQMAEMQDKIAQRQKQRQFLDNLPDPTFAAGQQALAGGGGPTMANAANVRPVSPQQQMMFNAAKAGLLELPDYFKATTPKQDEWSPTPQLMRDPTSGKVVPVLVSKSGQTKVLPFGAKPDIQLQDTGSGFQAVDKNEIGHGFSLPKTGNPFNDLLVNGPNGITPNVPLIDAKKQIAKSGASSVRIENKMGESLAGQVGPMVKDSRIQTDGAVKMFDAADRIERALNSDKVIAGPGASKIQTVRQFAQMVGGGNDEGIRQTRQVVKSLAQMAVEARKQLQGQGQVTESEAKAVMKADGGEIDELTTGELRDLVTLTKRAAHFTAKGHSDVLNQLGANPGTASLVPFYKVPRMEELLKHEPKLPQIGSQPSVDDLLKKYGGR